MVRSDPRRGKETAGLSEQVFAWAIIAEKYHADEISKEEYDRWRYYYLQYDDTQITETVPSQAFSDPWSSI